MTQRLIKQLPVGSLLLMGFDPGAAGSCRSGVSRRCSPRSRSPLFRISRPTSTAWAAMRKPGMAPLCPAARSLSLTIDRKSLQHGVHNEENVACVDCHTNISSFPASPLAGRDARDGLASSSIPPARIATPNSTTRCWIAFIRKRLPAATSMQRSAPIAIIRISRRASPTSRPASCSRRRVSSIPDTCARCHSTIFDTYKNSVHGGALTATGNKDVPTCIDCHGVHNIQNPTEAAFRNDIPQLCAHCHTDPQIVGKYGISTNVLNTYVADFHGTTVTLFEQVSPNTPTNKPVCTDCHGVHDISKVDNPVTGITIKQNLLTKCQRCHPDVTTASFTMPG